MKTIRFIAITLLILLAIHTATAETYTRGAYVSKINYKKDFIKLTDCEGQVWKMNDTANWEKGDVLLVWFDDSDTPLDRTDDKIVDYRWTGFTMFDFRSAWGEGVD